jgi:hypothetical protein
MTATKPGFQIAELIAATENEILSLVRDRDPSTHGVYEMVRYHLGLDGSGAPAGKRMRPLLGLLAYASITGRYEPALPGAAAVAARRSGRGTASPRRSTPATCCSA